METTIMENQMEKKWKMKWKRANIIKNRNMSCCGRKLTGVPCNQTVFLSHEDSDGAASAQCPPP